MRSETMGDLEMKRCELPRMTYHQRLREYEKDKQRLVPECETTADVNDLLRTLREKWRI